MFEKLFPLLNSVYPDLCIACDSEYPVKGSCFCVSCIADLPFTNLHEQRDNIVEKYFWGRLLLEKGTALFYFQKGELVQEMLHRLKYKEQAFIGNSIGCYFGEALKRSEFTKDVDLLLPIPIHKSKLKVRSYNQSELIAHGIGKITSLPVLSKNLLKISKTPSQTDKTREERLQKS